MVTGFIRVAESRDGQPSAEVVWVPLPAPDAREKIGRAEDEPGGGGGGCQRHSSHLLEHFVLARPSAATRCPGTGPLEHTVLGPLSAQWAQAVWPGK